MLYALLIDVCSQGGRATMLGMVPLIAAAAAAAPPATPQDKASQDIVVTGERVRRRLRETASSVHVASAPEIEAQPVDRVEQLLASVPNLQLGHGSEGPAIRGLDTTGALQALPAFLGGNRPRTTLVVDGRAVSYNEFVFGTAGVWDVERVEIYRSPQTTTQGQNSIAGAIFVYTEEPSFEPEARFRLLAGDFHTRQASLAASAPVNGDIAVRIAGDVRYSRTTTRIADRAEGADPNHDVYGTVRAKLLAQPAALPGTRLLLTYAHQQSQAPQVLGLTPPFRKRRDEDGFYGTFRINVDSLTAAIRHESGDVTANVVLTAGDSLAKRLAFPGLGQSRIDGRDWSAEAVVNWTPDGPLQLTGGFSRKHLQLKQFIDLSLISAIGRFRDAQDGSGVFGEASVKLLPRLTASAGLRYQRDRQKRRGALDAGPATVTLDYDRTFDAWLPKVSLAYDFTPTVTAGVLIEKAYNPGGTTLRFDIGQPDNFEAESLWDYELFARGVFAGGRLTANANAFYYDMRNAQRAKDILIIGPGGFRAGFADLFNAPRAHTYGAEAELGWRPSMRFSGRLSLGLLRTKMVDAGAGYPELSGNEFSRSPHFTAAAAAEWRPFPSLLLSAQARHHSGFWADEINEPIVRVPASTIIDARAEYRFSGRVSVFAYARNLFDKFALVDRYDDISASAEDARMVGIGVDVTF
jgi:outer membrane receptor protein involved in Fe transport